MALVDILRVARVVRESSSLVIVTHEVDEVDVLVETRNVEVDVVDGTGWDGESEQEMRLAGQVASIVVEFHAEKTAGVDEIRGFLLVGRVFPVDVETVEALDTLSVCVGLAVVQRI